MKVSVVIPVHNRQAELADAIQSVFDQALRPDEVIVVDDGSSPAISIPSVFLVDALIKIKLLRNSSSVGAAESRNIGVNYSSGDWVAFLDSDDIWLRDKLALQLELIASNEKIGMVACNLLYRRNGEYIEGDKRVPGGSIKNALLKGWTPPNTSTVMIKKKIFCRLGGMDKSVETCEDHDLWLRFCFFGYYAEVLNSCLSIQDIDDRDRLSKCFSSRVAGAEIFIARWGCKGAGWGNIFSRYLFRARYRANCYSVFVKTLSFKNFGAVFRSPVVWLFVNPYFYQRVLSRSVRICSSSIKRFFRALRRIRPPQRDNFVR